MTRAWIALAALLVGCTSLRQTLVASGKSYVRAEVTYVGAVVEPIRRDVRATPALQTLGPTLKLVALRMPDACVTTTASVASGMSYTADVLLATQCAYWLGALERALASAGIRVVSWDAVHRLERQKKLTPYQAAAQLGADGVLLLGSLDTSLVRTCPHQGFRVDYFQSDLRAGRGAPAALPTAARETMTGVVRGDFEAARSPSAGTVWQIAATLDATLMTSSGEAIWFYRGTAVVPMAHMARQMFLFRGTGAHWRPVVAEARADDPGDFKASTDYVLLGPSSGPAAADPAQAQRAYLVQQVADDALVQFRSGATGVGVPATPTDRANSGAVRAYDPPRWQASLPWSARDPWDGPVWHVGVGGGLHFARAAGDEAWRGRIGDETLEFGNRMIALRLGLLHKGWHPQVGLALRQLVAFVAHDWGSPDVQVGAYFGRVEYDWLVGAGVHMAFEPLGLRITWYDRVRLEFSVPIGTWATDRDLAGGVGVALRLGWLWHWGEVL